MEAMSKGLLLEKERVVFTGDTLFSLGCGRIFEGTHEDMFNSLKKLKMLPPETQVYCGHEYTKKNLDFCLYYDQENTLLKEKSFLVNSRLNKKSPTVPTSIKEELKMNIFLRCDNASIKKALKLENSSEQEVFTKLRDLKDNF